jgi:hypothetical protein
MPIRFDPAAPYEAGAAVPTALIWPEAIDNDFDIGAALHLPESAVPDASAVGLQADDTWEAAQQAIKPMHLGQPWELVASSMTNSNVGCRCVQAALMARGGGMPTI